MRDFAGLLSDLTHLAATLNRESDELTSLIDQFEATLSELKLGLEVWLEKPVLTAPCDDEAGVPAGTLHTYLGYVRGKQGWGLYLSDHWGGGETGKQRLRDASRAERTAAVAVFPEFLAAMKQAAQEAIGDIRRVMKPGYAPQAFTAEPQMFAVQKRPGRHVVSQAECPDCLPGYPVTCNCLAGELGKVTSREAAQGLYHAEEIDGVRHVRCDRHGIPK